MAQNNLSPISEFDPYGPNAKNRWNAYKEQLDTYFDASEIPDNMKRSTLLEMGGTKIRSIKVLLENTLKICRNYESAPRKMCDFDDLTESVNLNASTSHDKPRKSKKHRKQILCDRCGADDHYAHRCPKKLNAKCKYCGKDGHLEQVCWEKKKEKYRSQEGWPRRGYRLSLNRIIAGDYSTGENKEPPSSETPETTSKEIKP
ncbi:hypothetical protein BLOT_007399 [Blomia tropicalis]|nr:hypothetical protein BLOT_007399 [Blomia tropicalis]